MAGGMMSMLMVPQGVGRPNQRAVRVRMLMMMEKQPQPLLDESLMMVFGWWVKGWR